VVWENLVNKIAQKRLFLPDLLESKLSIRHQVTCSDSCSTSTVGRGQGMGSKLFLGGILLRVGDDFLLSYNEFRPNQVFL
jgi:hypothetical protein